MDNFEFANKISEKRRQKGMSQKELGDMLGVSNKAVSKWENGEAMPKTATLIKIAEIFDMDAGELIGIEQEIKPVADDGKIKNLEQENLELRTRLDEINKRKKNIFRFALIICIICIGGVVVFALCFGLNTDTQNKELKDIGEDNTKIVFNNVTFEPPNPLEARAIKSSGFDYYDNDETKYADYYDSNGNKHTAVISTSKTNQEYIIICRGSKEYYYINNENHLTMNKSTLYSLSFYENYSIANIASGIPDFDDYISYISKEVSLNYGGDDNKRTIELFCDFYNNKGKPVDKKTVELNLGKSSIMVCGEFRSDLSYAELGEFFKDDKGNTYFYDYSDGTAYSVTKELSDYVY